MDNMLQIKILQEDSRGVLVPTYIKKLCIDAKQHAAEVHELESKNEDVGKSVAFSFGN
jgi:hypothetical protein